MTMVESAPWPLVRDLAISVASSIEATASVAPRRSAASRLQAHRVDRDDRIRRRSARPPGPR